MRTFLIALIILSSAARAPAVDYAKIDRSLTKEPVYTSKSPSYALLVFGREARLRAWVVLDGDVLYLDRNGDGDRTAKDERFGKISECSAWKEGNVAPSTIELRVAKPEPGKKTGAK